MENIKPKEVVTTALFALVVAGVWSMGFIWPVIHSIMASGFALVIGLFPLWLAMEGS